MMNSVDNDVKKLDALWRDYKILNDKNARNRAIEHYAPFSKICRR